MVLVIVGRAGSVAENSTLFICVILASIYEMETYA